MMLYLVKNTHVGVVFSERVRRAVGSAVNVVLSNLFIIIVPILVGRFFLIANLCPVFMLRSLDGVSFPLCCRSLWLNLLGSACASLCAYLHNLATTPFILPFLFGFIISIDEPLKQRHIYLIQLVRDALEYASLSRKLDPTQCHHEVYPCMPQPTSVRIHG